MNSKFFKLFLGFAMLGMMSENLSTGHHWNELTPDEKEEIERIRKKKRLELLKKQGLKEFHTEAGCVIALNQKNADRKAKNILKQLPQ